MVLVCGVRELMDKTQVGRLGRRRVAIVNYFGYFGRYTLLSFYMCV